MKQTTMNFNACKLLKQQAPGASPGTSQAEAVDLGSAESLEIVAVCELQVTKEASARRLLISAQLAMVRQ